MSNSIKKESYKKLIHGEIPPWVRRFIKLTCRGINEHHMIKDGDTVLLGISGGKDSLALALALSLRLKWMPINYTLKALHIDWIEHPVPQDGVHDLTAFFEDLQIPFESVKASMFPESFNNDFNCYLCARNRRRILFTYAEKHSIPLIALGHHLDDLVETSLINLCFRGDFSTMLPVQEFFQGSLHVIRPMIKVKEQTIIRLKNTYDFPVVKPVCPYDHTNIRAKVKPIIHQLSEIDKHTRDHIYKAHTFDYRIDEFK